MPRPLHKIETSARRLPDWLRKDLKPGHQAATTDKLLKDLQLHTICESGRCPNRNECYSQKTATFMILGDVCTRTCRFCSVSMGRPSKVDADEPNRLAEAVWRLGLRHVVITSVNRDDLADEGAAHFADVIRAIKRLDSGTIIEILTPDFIRTQERAVEIVLEAGPHIFSHNLETVPRLYRSVRPQAVYEKSLAIFSIIKSKASAVLTKSGLMLGLGESDEEVIGVLKDLRSAGCDMLTLGQYLQSSSLGIPVSRYVSPELFSSLKQAALGAGFSWVESAPFVRSSFHAEDSFRSLQDMLGFARVGA